MDASLGNDIEGFYDLSEIVRLYVRAVLNRRGSSFLYGTVATGDDTVEFGVSDPKAFKKSRRKKKKSKAQALPPALESALNAGAYEVTDEELESLASAAASAASEARKRAGGDVLWCCGCLRVKSRINYTCECAQNEIYRIVNERIKESGT